MQVAVPGVESVRAGCAIHPRMWGSRRSCSMRVTSGCLAFLDRRGSDVRRCRSCECWKGRVRCTETRGRARRPARGCLQLCSSLLKPFHSHILNHSHHFEYPKHTLNFYYDLCLLWSDFGNRFLGSLFIHLNTCHGDKQDVVALIVAFTIRLKYMDTKLVIDLLAQQRDSIDAIDYIKTSREAGGNPSIKTKSAFPALTTLDEAYSTTTTHAIDSKS